MFATESTEGWYEWHRGYRFCASTTNPSRVRIENRYGDLVEVVDTTEQARQEVDSWLDHPGAKA